MHCSPTLDRQKLDFPGCCTAPQPGAALLPVRVRVWGEAGPDAQF